MKIVNKFQTVVCALLVMAVLQLQAPDCAEAQRSLDGVMYAGVWCPTTETTGNFDAAAKEVFEKDRVELNKSVFELLKKEYPIIIKKLGLYFDEKLDADSSKRSRLFTIVLSRATDTVKEYRVKGKYFEQHFFDITISLVIVNSNTSVVEYSRVLTGELPVLEKIRLTDEKKKEYFLKAFKKTIVSLMKKAANEFKTMYSDEEPLYYFQVTHIKLKDDAKEVLKEYEHDLIQFLHDALVLRAREAGIEVRFLPLESKWNTEIWEVFEKNFDVKVGEVKHGNEKRESLITRGKYLTISTIVQKAKKVLLKESAIIQEGEAIEAYYSYLVYTAAAVVQRDKAMKKVDVLPKKGSKKVAKGSGEKTLHYVKGSSSNSDIFLFLDAAQQSLGDLSKELIELCKKSMDELINS